MADVVSPEQRSEIMRRIRGKDTGPEMLVRRLVFSLGYRYRLHYGKLPGSPDLVFPGRRKVIFVHGCFWHHHDDPDCPISHQPRSNQEFWKAKFQRNRERDARNQLALQEDGWDVLIVWECQLKDREQLETRLRRFLDASAEDRLRTP